MPQQQHTGAAIGSGALILVGLGLLVLFVTSTSKRGGLFG